MDNRSSRNFVGEPDSVVGREGTPCGVLSPFARQPVVKSLSFHECPDYCHAFSSKTGILSQRTRAAAGAYLHWCSSKKISRNTVRNRKKHERRKRKKQHDKLLLVTITERMNSIGAIFSNKYLKENVVVFDGGINAEATATAKIEVPGWNCLRIDHGVLEVCMPPNDDMGLMYRGLQDDQPRFMLLPRREAIQINKNSTKLCCAMINISQKQHNLVRGASKSVFGQEKYCCVGSKPRRTAVGIEPGQFNYTDGVSTDDWDTIVNAVKRCEQAFYSYVGTEVIRHIREARNTVLWERIRYSGKKVVPDLQYSMESHLV